MLKDHPLVNTLIHLKGNPRACVYTEPMYSVPYNLYLPYVSVYMYALGISDSQIGLIASIGMALQIVFALLSGVITDKLGRRTTTFVFDIISWSIPCLIWAVANNFAYFVVAAIINSVFKVTANSWGCLLVEDSDKERIVNIFTLVYISGLLAAFFAPVAGLFIGWFDLVPTIRVIYMIAFILMTLKFAILYKYSSETAQGRIRMEETRHMNMLQLLRGYGGVIRQLLKTPETMLTLGIMLIMSICTMVNGTFWSIIVTQRLDIPAKNLGLFQPLRSLVMLSFFITVLPKVRAVRFKKPLLTGFSIFIASQLLLILTPEKGYAVLIASVLLEACGLSLINPLLDSMQAVLVDPQERARLIAVMYVAIIALSSPFGWIAGILSGVDRRLPFMMNITLLALGILFVLLVTFRARGKAAEE